MYSGAYGIFNQNYEKIKKIKLKNYKFLLKNCNNYIKKQKEIFVIV